MRVRYSQDWVFSHTMYILEYEGYNFTLATMASLRCILDHLTL